ncbi:MAG: threonine aldolase family protein [Solirubrobacteraceae bacterium]
MPNERGFASDNAATVHPAVLAAIARVNVGHAFGYGHDEHTERVLRRLEAEFGEQARAYLVWNGTAANVLSIRAVCRPGEAVICADTAHLNVDEGGAPEAIAGVKLLAVPGVDGKLTPELVDARIERLEDEHAVQPRLVSVTQATELGTVYGLQELSALAVLAHERGLLLHLDGARLANACAALGVSLRQATVEVGVDVVSFGGTKNGLLGAEAVLLLEPSLADRFDYLRKSSMQLASKMRFLAAQFEALMTDELWLRGATHANAMAARLSAALTGVPAVRITRPVEVNAVFARLPRPAIEILKAKFAFYVWDERADEVRWMCSWDTTEEDVDEFAAAVAQTVG